MAITHVTVYQEDIMGKIHKSREPIEVTAHGDSERVFIEGGKMATYNRPAPDTERPDCRPTIADMVTQTPQLGGVLELEEVKHYCGYCPGMTFDDSRGHCCACGGPRMKAQPAIQDYAYPSGQEQSDDFDNTYGNSRWGSVLKCWALGEGELGSDSILE